MRIHDARPIAEQVKSGIHLAGWALFAILFIALLATSALFLIGKVTYAHPWLRVIAGCILVAGCTLMYETVRWWAKWFVGFLVYFTFKAAVSAVLGFTPTAPTIAAPRLVFLGMFVTFVVAVLLSARYINRPPHKLETIGLVLLALSIVFSMILNSNLPVAAATLVLLVFQLAARKRHSRTQPELNKVT